MTYPFPVAVAVPGRTFGPTAVLTLLVFLLSGCTSTNDDQSTRDDGGIIVDGGDVGVNRLRVGDCFDDVDPGELDGEFTDVEAVEAKPCGEPHTYEVYYLGALPEGEFPGEQNVNDQVDGQCLELFESYVAIDYASSTLDYSYIFPSEQSWIDGDRGYVCTLYSAAGEQLERSMRDSAR